MTAFFKAYAIWIFIILAVLIGIGIAASEYLDAATSLLPGGEGTG